MSEDAKDEVTKPLIVTDALKLEAVVTNGKLRVGSQSINDGERLTLHSNEILTIEVDAAHRVVVTRRPKPVEKPVE